MFYLFILFWQRVYYVFIVHYPSSGIQKEVNSLGQINRPGAALFRSSVLGDGSSCNSEESITVIIMYTCVFMHLTDIESGRGIG